jgi:hypothetical protein
MRRVTRHVVSSHRRVLSTFARSSLGLSALGLSHLVSRFLVASRGLPSHGLRSYRQPIFQSTVASRPLPAYLLLSSAPFPLLPAIITTRRPFASHYHDTTLYLRQCRSTPLQAPMHNPTRRPTDPHACSHVHSLGNSTQCSTLIDSIADATAPQPRPPFSPLFSALCARHISTFSTWLFFSAKMLGILFRRR